MDWRVLSHLISRCQQVLRVQTHLLADPLQLRAVAGIAQIQIEIGTLGGPVGAVVSRFHAFVQKGQ